MLELILLSLKYLAKLSLRTLCLLRYINHNYYITDLSAPYTDGFVTGGKYYDFQFTCKCSLCGRVKKMSYYMDFEKWERGIEDSEIEIIERNIQENEDGEFVVILENDVNERDIRCLFKHSGIYKIKNTSKEFKNYLDRYDYIKTKRYGEYLFIAVLTKKNKHINQTH